MSVALHHGDCLTVMAQLPDASVDAVVTDPPYGLGFMGKAWDDLPPGVEWAAECLRVLKPGGHLLAFGGSRTWHRLTVSVEDAGFEVRDSIAWLYGSGFPKSLNLGDGLGTALKPAFEPIIVARKPLSGTVAGNVLAHGTGALNIDGCRVDSGARPLRLRDERPREPGDFQQGAKAAGDTTAGRWPANVILDESQAAELDAQGGILHSQATSNRSQVRGDTDFGGASRFFYVAKADASERVRVNGTAHPTVKPLALMRWLVRLVTPPGGVVLEPFAGSGTTVEACILEGFDCIAIEREADYLPLIQQRIDRRIDPVAAIKALTEEDGGLFDLLDGGAA